MGAIAHLYRGEVYRSTIWRTRLDNTTNWSIVTMGIALSTTFSSPEASPLPLLLVGLLIAVFLGMEARRYRYFNVWRARARWLEMNFYAPIFTGEARDDSWQAVLARDYTAPRHHISFVRAAGYLCVPKTLSELMTWWNRLNWRNDRAALFLSCRLGLTI
jgi:uncharacterized membrane protein